MDSPEYASKVFLRHWDRVDFPRKTDEFHALELGCGDSLASGLMGRSLGATKYYLVDAGNFAAAEILTYQRMASALSQTGWAMPDISGCGSVEEMLGSVNALYLKQGIASFSQIPDKTVDFIWSQAVFEHIGRGEFAEAMRQMRRVIRDDGVMSHRVDLKDHLGGALNNLRFPADIWESPVITKSGFYTNRIRYNEMISLMRSSGFDVQVVRAERWTTLPTRRAALSVEFQSLDVDDLLVSGFDVVLKPV